MTGPDLLLVGGEVVDETAGLSGRQDVAVTGGVVTAIGPDLDRTGARRVVDVSGALVTAGLVDLHTHVFAPGAAFCVEPDVAGVGAGVTTVVDAGSSGATNLAQFRPVAEAARTDVVPFVHIGLRGLAHRPDVGSAADLDPDATAAVLDEHADLVRGVKVRMVSPGLQTVGLDLLRTARSVAHGAGVPVMVHVGDIDGPGAPNLGPDTLDLLDAGDIVTHAFTANPGGLLDEHGVLHPAARAAAERGVLFDAAHGCRNLSFDVARRVLDQGVPLTAISTDMTQAGKERIVFSLTDVMSRYLAFGFSVPEIVTRVTAGPAAAAGIAERAGTLAVGRPADISVLRLTDGEWTAEDSFGHHLTLTRRFTADFCLRNGVECVRWAG